ncbi:MAG TPA: class I SAM-dependent methyltransferase [Acidimicrobiia bacterium]|nr:class I SAM-dependent methyltransferase [Acidimicrobiia bacterium]
MSGVSDPIFAKIARRYDRINRILSFGRETAWRAVGVGMLEPGLVLDLGCGTGDTDFEGRSVIGLDPVIEMLALSPVAAKVVAVGEKLPIEDESVDGVFSAFVFRNLSSIDLALGEIARVLKPGCSAVVIDLGRPTNPFLRFLHRIGTAVILPIVGLLFAGAPREYWYLHQTLDALPPPEILYARCPLILEEVWRSGLFGFVYGVRLRKPLETAEEEPPEAA